METRTVSSPMNGQRIPVNAEIERKLNVQPLMYEGKVVKNGNGKVVMNDQWIYVNMPHHGMVAINVHRAEYCQKMYMSQITIQETIGNKLMDTDLQKFVEQVSDKIVFEKYGKWYRVELYKKTSRTFGLKKVQLYKWVVDPNRKFDGIFAYNLSIDWKSAFYVR